MAGRSGLPAPAADAQFDLCHVNLARGFRGGERQTELLVRALTGHVARQQLVVREGAPLGARCQNLAGVTVTGVRGRTGAVAAASGARLVHAHETHGAQAALIRNCLSRTPYVLTRRVDNVPHGDFFTRSMYRRAAATVVLSRAIAQVLARYDPTLEVHRIPSAASQLDSDPAWVRSFRTEHRDRFVVGCIGALDHRHKGQFTLIAAAKMIAASRPRVHFVLVGTGPDEAAMKRAAADLPNVSFAGWVANPGDFLAAFDLFAFPSLHEGLGSILIDAMQFGLPIVASAVGGIPELVSDHENGLLVNAGDPRALAAAIGALHDDPVARSAMSAANRERARAFAPAVMAQSYLALYGRLVAGLGEPDSVRQ